MQIYDVRISHAAYADMTVLRVFLNSILSEEGAVRYANSMRSEIKLLGVYADCFRCSTSITLRQIHPKARRMISHNRKWLYVYHIEENYVVVDRILPVKMNKG